MGDWRRTHYSSDIRPDRDGEEVILFGWIQDIRDLGRILFLTLRDKDGVVQVTVKKADATQPLLDTISKMGKEYAIGLRGKIRATKESARGVEVVPLEAKILGEVKYPLPLDPTGRVPAEIDARLNARILDLRRPQPRAIFGIRDQILATTRRFFNTNGFVEIQTPRLIGTATEGGAALFPVEYFDTKAYLAQSPQLYKEQLITVFERVCEIGPFFRAEEHDTRRHINEFTSVDIEQAFVEATDVMTILEELTTEIIVDLREKRSEDLRTLQIQLKPPRRPFMRHSYDEILEELQTKNVDIKWGDDIDTPAYRTLQDLHKEEYYFITDWPTKIKAFYIKPHEDNSLISHGFDLMYEWMEVASGGSRVDRKDDLIRRLEENGLDPGQFREHLKTYEYGMPPHAGWAFGLERLLMALLGIENVREVILFPRDRYRLMP
ncbi:MAG: aspartate--tRNA(Asn) ligase [archaeon]